MLRKLTRVIDGILNIHYEWSPEEEKLVHEHLRLEATRATQEGRYHAIICYASQKSIDDQLSGLYQVYGWKLPITIGPLSEYAYTVYVFHGACTVRGLPWGDLGKLSYSTCEYRLNDSLIFQEKNGPAEPEDYARAIYDLREPDRNKNVIIFWKNKPGTFGSLGSFTTTDVEIRGTLYNCYCTDEEITFRTKGWNVPGNWNYGFERGIKLPSVLEAKLNGPADETAIREELARSDPILNVLIVYKTRDEEIHWLEKNIPVDCQTREVTISGGSYVVRTFAGAASLKTKGWGGFGNWAHGGRFTKRDYSVTFEDVADQVTKLKQALDEAINEYWVDGKNVMIYNAKLEFKTAERKLERELKIRSGLHIFRVEIFVGKGVYETNGWSGGHNWAYKGVSVALSKEKTKVEFGKFFPKPKFDLSDSISTPQLCL